TWGTFASAVAAYQRLGARAPDPVLGPIAGLGVVLTDDLGVACLDLDRVLDETGTLDARAAKVIRLCHSSWTEISPSGHGLHVFVEGRLPRAIKGTQIEVYSRDRYIAVTGHQWP